jgi:CheY-like chemotaxis protein
MGPFTPAVSISPRRDHSLGFVVASGIVLVVEDEGLIRVNAVQLVEDAGYTPLEASNAEEAIEILKRRDDIRVVFTDVNMCGSRSGVELAHLIRYRWQPIHLIVTSGLAIEAALPFGTRVIRKPYENSRIAALLHELFELE